MFHFNAVNQAKGLQWSDPQEKPSHPTYPVSGTHHREVLVSYTSNPGATALGTV